MGADTERFLDRQKEKGQEKEIVKETEADNKKQRETETEKGPEIKKKTSQTD